MNKSRRNCLIVHEIEWQRVITTIYLYERCIAKICIRCFNMRSLGILHSLQFCEKSNLNLNPSTSVTCIAFAFLRKKKSQFSLLRWGLTEGCILSHFNYHNKKFCSFFFKMIQNHHGSSYSWIHHPSLILCRRYPIKIV